MVDRWNLVGDYERDVEFTTYIKQFPDRVFLVCDFEIPRKPLWLVYFKPFNKYLWEEQDLEDLVMIEYEGQYIYSNCVLSCYISPNNLIAKANILDRNVSLVRKIDVNSYEAELILEMIENEN